MGGRFRLPMFVIAAALFGLLALLATLQYRWLGRISEAERESRRSTLTARAAAFASDFDKELTLAYMLFQLEPSLQNAAVEDSLAARLSARHERWQSTSRYPRLIKDYYIASRDSDGTARLRRFNPSTKFVEPADWPESLAELRKQITAFDVPAEERRGAEPRTFVVRSVPGPLWDDVPALVVAMPLVLLNPVQSHSAPRLGHLLSYTVLLLDREYISREMLPALEQQHLRGIGDGVAYEAAVVNGTGRGIIYRSTSRFEPAPDEKVDATAGLFQVRTQEFAQMAADVRRFIAAIPESSAAHTTIAEVRRSRSGAVLGSPPASGTRVVIQTESKADSDPDQPGGVRGRALVTSFASALTTRTATMPPKWRLLVKHPSGSLEAAVNSARRQNLMISSSILAVLAASMALLVLSTRRSQEVARQQMEFVAAVSHELRTPLAVIRSAGDNLAAGVVGDPDRIRKYGDLVRSEGRRLSEMVEQILEFAGIHSGQRRFEPRPVDVATLLHDVLAASRALIDDARIDVQVDVPDSLPPVLGDEAGLRRVFQNLVGNAIKYGANGRWIGLRARSNNREVCVAVADRGIGIAPVEQGRIFEPFYRAAEVVAAQIQGAGLGLSLVQRIVEAHGGRITVKSAPGAGSEFSVYLRAAGPEPVAGADPHAAEAPRYT